MENYRQYVQEASALNAGGTGPALSYSEWNRQQHAAFLAEMRGHVRFWVRVNGGDVRLTIRPGQTLKWSRGDETDEGYRIEVKIWTCHHGAVTLEWGSDETDCDGRHTRSGDAMCLIADLNAGLSTDEEPHIVFPKWTWGKTSSRDHRAESMGY